MAPTVGYWNIRGLCESIRYLLSYKGVDFEDKRYNDYGLWMKDKFSLNLDFPNLPYYIDGDVRMTQSITIMRYLARKHNLEGKDDEQKLLVEFAEQQIVDLRTSLLRRCYYSPNRETFEKLKEELIKNLPDLMKRWSEFLGDQKFLAGDNLTYVDFLAYEAFDFHEMLLPTIYNDFPNIKEYLRRFESLPELQSHFKSPSYKRWPFFGPLAYFGGSGEEPPKAH